MEKIAVRTKEAAQLLSISQRHLADLIKKGEFPRIKSGTANLILVDDIKAWVARRKDKSNG